MYCKNCGEVMNDNQAICLKCGVQKGVGNRFCHNCGSQLPEGAAVCLNCGFAVVDEAAKKAQEQANYLNGKDKVTVALLCFFFGGIGIHNFMLGETKKGVFKIVMTCCFGIGAILALIDFIKILTDSYQVDPEKLI